MANNSPQINFLELKEFTNIQLKIALGATTNADFSKMTTQDATLAIEYFEDINNQKLFKSWINKNFSGGTGWQGVINDLKPESYQIIREVIKRTNHPIKQNFKVGLNSLKKAEIISRLYPNY